MRSSAFGTSFVRPCVRDVFCCSAFPLVSPLPSTASAVLFVSRTLFGSFVGSMGLSDCLHPFITRLWMLSFTVRSSFPSSEEGCRLSRFSRIEFLYMQEVSDRARANMHSPSCACPCCLPLRLTASAPRTHYFRGSILCLYMPLSLLRP